MSAYGGGFIYLFQHYLSSDSMSFKNLTVGNIAQKQKDFTVNWNIPFDKQGRWSILNLSVYEKYLISKFLDT